MRRAGDRAMEPLQGRLADRNPEIAAVAAEFMGLTGGHQAVALLLPLLRHRSEFVREAALVGLAEAGGREISRPAMPSLKDESVLVRAAAARAIGVGGEAASTRSEEHTSELQSLAYLVCRLLLEKKKRPGARLSD